MTEVIEANDWFEHRTSDSRDEVDFKFYSFGASMKDKIVAFLKEYGIYIIIGVGAYILGCMISGCGRQEVAFDTLEQARAQARENAEWNAQTFRANDPRFEGLKIVTRGDSTQAPDCPQGDGWASIDFMDPATRGIVWKTKCSTVSVSVGCMTQADFETKIYAKEDGHCQNASKVPFPLPKLVK